MEEITLFDFLLTKNIKNDIFYVSKYKDLYYRTQKYHFDNKLDACANEFVENFKFPNNKNNVISDSEYLVHKKKRYINFLTPNDLRWEGYNSVPKIHYYIKDSPVFLKDEVIDTFYTEQSGNFTSLERIFQRFYENVKYMSKDKNEIIKILSNVMLCIKIQTLFYPLFIITYIDHNLIKKLNDKMFLVIYKNSNAKLYTTLKNIKEIMSKSKERVDFPSNVKNNTRYIISALKNSEYKDLVDDIEYYDSYNVDQKTILKIFEILEILQSKGDESYELRRKIKNELVLMNINYYKQNYSFAETVLD